MTDADEPTDRPDAGFEGGDTAERPAVRPSAASPEQAPETERLSLMDPDEPTEEPVAQQRRTGRVVALSALALVLLAAGLYVAAYAVAGDKVARGTSVAGVDIGGLTQEDAEQALEDGLADRVQRPIAVTVADSDLSDELDPGAAGLEVDYAASVAAAGGERSWAPRRLWDYFTGGDELPAVVEADDAAVEEFLAGLEEAAGQPPVEGAIAFTDGQPVVTDPMPGRGFERDAAVAAIEDAFVAEDGTVELALADVAPTIDADEIETALATFAEPAMSGPVTLVFGETPVELDPVEYAPAVSMVAEDGALVGRVDGAVLKDLVDDRVGDPGRPVDATVVIENGEPVVVPAEPGVDFLPDTLAAVFTEVVTAPEGSREGTVEAEAVEPEFTTADAEALGIVEEVSEFTTYYPHAPYRNTNIGRAAELIDGTVLKPGDVFSLNGIVGERTYENGFTDGFIISNGIFRSEPGGGVSQMATTTFNAAYFAGLKDVEHKPHSLYIDRYPEGREATVAWPTVDLKFENDTEHGVLVQAILSPSSPGNRGSITVRMWSTKTWDIESDVSGRYAVTSSSTRTLDTADCEPQSGSSGFSVDYDRIFREPGSDEIVRTEDFSWTYSPTPTIRCVSPEPEPTPPPVEQADPVEPGEAGTGG
ncbi:vancomycin resistance protein YoaR [Nocardioides zeae]|uniref:Vancomycin resistance protein YoaR n=1 Tax=Nocardioides zeae TaxID=1457234 RepID=A0ACC6IJU6_9ACTN|nr:VanW family protein [Nocardioides zeae]MDR6173630.1 vancomycin resistance protein YoaR [Nocardioides zeae]MDR6211036.1 vancomycin resistance protein YoaR [Nocardioides zeae]